MLAAAVAVTTRKGLTNLFMPDPDEIDPRAGGPRTSVDQYGRGSGAVVASRLRPFDAITSRYHLPESLIVRFCVS